MFSVLLALFVAGFGLSIYLILLLFLNPKKYQVPYKDSTIVIVKIVELHRENLPLNSAHGWNLTPSNCTLRCWQKNLQLGATGDTVSVYACAKEIPCAAVILLNVIADVSTWSEWDVLVQDQIVHLELPDSASLHGDRYMQCDQVLTSSKARVKPEIEMFRFGNLESNGTGWILLWNAKKLDWTLYIAQPIDAENSDDCNDVQIPKERCLLTAMWGCKELPTDQRNMPSELCRKVLGLSEAISLSQLNIRPFKSLLHPSSTSNPHFPTIRSALEDLPKKPCVLLDKDKCLPLQNGTLAVIPLSNQKPLTLSNITGFTLVLNQLKKNSSTLGSSGEGNEEKRRSRRRQKVRSDSISSGFPKMKHLDIDNKRSSSLTTPSRKKPPELTVTQAEDEAQPPQRAASHSFLHNFFQRRWSHNDISDRSRSPSPSQSTTSKRRFFGFQKTSSMSSQEDVSSRSSFQDLDLSDNEMAAEYFSTTHSLQNTSSDFKSLGEYSISAVLQENLKAAMVDAKATEDEQKKQSGGWVLKDNSKNIAILKKTTYLDACVLVSYLCRGAIPTPLPTVWKTLCNPQTRFMYDDTVKKLSVLHEYPTGQKLIHMYNESLTLLHKEVRDFCILQTEKVEETKFILGFHSVKDPNCPPMKNVTRGMVVASGWVVEPLSENDDMCQVSYLIQMIVSGTDTSTLEEISHTQSQCIHNLSLYLTSKPPSYLPIHS